jgi:hypothetical protein
VEWVDVASTKPQDLASPQLAPHRQKDNESQMLGHGGSELFDLRHGRQGTFRWSFISRTLHLAGRCEDQPIGDCGAHDR